MECIYLKNLSECNKNYTVCETESKHLKALHINSNDKIMLTNGRGLSAIAKIDRPTKNEFYACVEEFLHGCGENKYKIILAIGILDNKDRFEFAIEKSTELGIDEIIPLITQFGKQIEINNERLKAKTISAIKQCKRSQLPIIHPPIQISKLLKQFSQTDVNIYNLAHNFCGNNKKEIIHDNNNIEYKNAYNIVLADENGENATEIKNKLNNKFDTYIFVGSEGGFSNEELEAFPNETIHIKLGNRRLRTETAATIATGIIACLL